MPEPLSIAVCQPRCESLDERLNAVAHADLIRRADARLVAFPELSLTGYEPGAPPIDPDGGVLEPILAACEETGSIALVGAPVSDAEGASYIGALLISAAGAEAAYRKCHLGGEEPRHYSAGDRPAAIEVDGRRIGLGMQGHRESRHT